MCDVDLPYPFFSLSYFPYPINVQEFTHDLLLGIIYSDLLPYPRVLSYPDFSITKFISFYPYTVILHTLSTSYIHYYTKTHMVSSI